MDIKEAIYSRRSVRQYEDRPIDKAVIDELLNAAVQAPTAMNTQPWAFAVIQDAATLKDISDKSKSLMLQIIGDNPEFTKYREILEDPNYHIFYCAPALVVILAKPNISPEPSIDCTLAAQNLMLTAHSLGLGSCWIGFAYAYLNTEEAKQTLGIPSDYNAIAPLIIGYPAGDLPVVEKNAPEVIFWK